MLKQSGLQVILLFLLCCACFLCYCVWQWGESLRGKIVFMQEHIRVQNDLLVSEKKLSELSYYTVNTCQNILSDVAVRLGLEDRNILVKSYYGHNVGKYNGIGGGPVEGTEKNAAK